eukprot:12039-Heterococcus_DN1.PRE.2
MQLAASGCSAGADALTTAHAVMGSGAKSSRSVCAGSRSGSIKCLNEMGTTSSSDNSAAALAVHAQ